MLLARYVVSSVAKADPLAFNIIGMIDSWFTSQRKAQQLLYRNGSEKPVGMSDTLSEIKLASLALGVTIPSHTQGALCGKQARLTLKFSGKLEGRQHQIPSVSSSRGVPSCSTSRAALCMSLASISRMFTQHMTTLC